MEGLCSIIQGTSRRRWLPFCRAEQPLARRMLSPTMPAGLPTLGQLVAEHSAGRFDGETVDAGMPEAYRQRLY